MASFGTEYQANNGYSADYSQPLLAQQIGNQDFPGLSTGPFSSSFYPMDSQVTSGPSFSLLSASPYDLQMENANSWDDLELSTSVSMDYSETAVSNGLDNYVDFEHSANNGMGMEKYLTSPISPNFSVDGLDQSLSPQFAIIPDLKDESASSPESQESDDLLEDLLMTVRPVGGKFRCIDAKAEDHTCDFVADRRCMLRKHLESSLRTNICRHPGCNGTQFSSKAVLTRHEKETHGMHEASVYKCPITSCERHTRSFPREYNMWDHIQRVHKDVDMTPYLKKSKRAKRSHAGSASSGSGSTSGSKPIISITNNGTVRKSSGRPRPQKNLEKRFRESQEKIKAFTINVCELSPMSSDITEVERLREEIDIMLQLRDTILKQNGRFSND